MNGSSLTGRHGGAIRAAAVALVRSGRAHVIASDAHRPTRGPVLGAALAALAAEGLAGAAVEALVAAVRGALLEHGMAARARRARRLFLSAGARRRAARRAR